MYNELIFTETLCPKPPNMIAECLHKHRTLAINEFKNEILPPLLQFFSKRTPKEDLYP